MVAPCDGGRALQRYAFSDRNDHPMSVTQHYSNHKELYNFIYLI